MPTSILILLFISGYWDRVWTMMSFSFTMSLRRFTTVTRRKYLNTGKRQEEIRALSTLQWKLGIKNHLRWTLSTLNCDVVVKQNNRTLGFGLDKELVVYLVVLILKWSQLRCGLQRHSAVINIKHRTWGMLTEYEIKFPNICCLLNCCRFGQHSTEMLTKFKRS